MLDIKNPVQAYEVFKLQWMIEHGATLSDLVQNLQLMLDEDLDGSDIPTSLQSLFSDWEFGFGFDGAIWPCFQGVPGTRLSFDDEIFHEIRKGE